jgi:hypothetical protein
MAANLFKQPLQESGFITTIVEGFKYNLELFPDLLLSIVCIYALVLQFPPFIALALSLLSVQLVQPILGNVFREILPGTWAAPARQEGTGFFPGLSLERVTLNRSAPPTTGIPSYYSMFVGTLVGWILPLMGLYSDELAASPKRALAYYISLGFAILIAVITLAYRWLASQDTFFGLLLGVGLGGVFGSILVWLVSLLTQRRATNLYSFPLITTSYGTTKPIYACKKQ